MKNLIMICLFLAMGIAARAQSHNMKPGWCKYAKKVRGTAKDESASAQCQACVNDRKKEDAAKAAEDKRRQEAAIAKAAADKRAFDIAYKKKQEERAAREKVTEVFVTMPSSSSSSASSTVKESPVNVGTAADAAGSGGSASESTTGTSTSSSSASNVTIHNNVFAAQAYKKQQQEQAYQDLAKGIYDLFAPSPEKLEADRRQREYQLKLQADHYNASQKLVKDNLQTALGGDSLAILNTYRGYTGTGSEETAMEFVDKMHAQYQSGATRNILKSIYQEKEKAYNAQIDLRRFDQRTNRAYMFMVLGGAAAAVPLLYKDKLVAKHGEDAGTATYILAGAGGVSILSALIAKIAIPPLSSKQKYREAVEGLKRIRARNLKATVLPQYNYLHNAPMLGLNLKF